MKFKQSWFMWSLAFALSVACGDKGDDGGSTGDGDGDTGDGDGDVGDGDGGDGDDGDGDAGDGDAGDGDGDAGDGDGDGGDGDGDAGDGDGDGTGGMPGMGGFGGAGLGGDGPSAGGSEDGSGGDSPTMTVLEEIEEVCQDISDRYTEAGNAMCAALILGCTNAAQTRPNCTSEFLVWHQCLLDSDSLGTPSCIETDDCLNAESAWRECGGGPPGPD